LRSKFILIVLGGAVLPLALLGLWLTRTAERSGEELLRARLQTSLSQVVDEIGLRWLSQRSQLLRLAESRAIQAALRDSLTTQAADDAALAELRTLYAGMGDAVGSAEILDMSDAARWNVGGDDGATRGGLQTEPTLTVRLGIFDAATGARLGNLDARVLMSGLLPGGAGWGGVSGSVLAVFDRSSGASLIPLSIDLGRGAVAHRATRVARAADGSRPGGAGDPVRRAVPGSGAPEPLDLGWKGESRRQPGTKWVV
jgi:hypothetical protein